VLRYDLPPAEACPNESDRNPSALVQPVVPAPDLPLYREPPGADGSIYPEVMNALAGGRGAVVRVTEAGELIVSVAVPVQRFRAVLGVLLLSTQAGDIDKIVHAERLAIFRVAGVAAMVNSVLSLLLASTIATPLRRLSAAAVRVRRGVKAREEIPDFSDRQDEIGNLSVALRDMTNALYDRIAAIESFAADVSHELKNPLTSLRSAVETLPLGAQRALPQAASWM
jgi:two-component system sensor histidine kinase ChvG